MVFRQDGRGWEESNRTREDMSNPAPQKSEDFFNLKNVVLVSIGIIRKIEIPA